MATDIGYRDDLLGIDMDFGGGRPRGCMWDRSICTASPTHQITVSQGEDTTSAPYCERHYVLMLRHLVHVHLPDCDGDVHPHATSYGPIEGRVEPTLAEEFADARAKFEEDCEDGLQALRKLIAKWSARLGRSDRQVLGVQAVLGAWLAQCGHKPEAISVCRLVLEEANNALGRSDDFTLDALQNLGALFVSAKEFHRAAGVYWALSLRRRQKLGATHPDTLFARRRHATLLAQTGDLTSAAQELSILRPILAEHEHPYRDNSAEALRTLVSVFSNLEQWVEVGELLSEALDMQVALFGVNHQITRDGRKQRWEIVRHALARYEKVHWNLDGRMALQSLTNDFARYLSSAERAKIQGAQAQETRSPETQAEPGPSAQIPLTYSADGLHLLAIEHALENLSRAQGGPFRSGERLDTAVEREPLVEDELHLLTFLVDQVPSRRAANLLLTALLDDELATEGNPHLLKVEALEAEIGRVSSKLWSAAEPGSTLLS